MADDTQLAEATQPLSFAEFLERMKEPAAADLVRSIKNFIKTFEDRKPDPERDSVLVQSFLTKSEAAFKQHPVWASAPPAHKSQAVEGLEKYLMTKIYHKTFATSELDRERDEALHVRMRALNFIKPSHLDIPELFRDEKAWILAMKELHKINNYKAPRDKLVCILNCCRVINNLLHVQVQHGEARGADDFLPVLIYVVIHANPPQLASNLEYIQRFRMGSRMVSESAYFFTQLYSAASFIETVNATSLSMDPDEFMARMIAAGVPDMQLAPSQYGATKPVPHPEKPPAFVTAQPTQDPAATFTANHSPPEGDSTPDQPPTGAALPTSAVPLQAELAAGTVLPIHSAPVAGRQAVVPDAATMLPDAGPTQYVAPAVPSTGMSALAAEASANLPANLAGDDAMQFQGRYPTVNEMERAGVSLVLEAEAAGYLKQHYRFLYAAAGDLLVTDVPELLALYKELALRYESLSRAVAQVASQSAALAAAAHLPVATDHASTRSVSVPQTAFAQPTTESVPQHAATVSLSSLPLESAATPATALALEEASETAEDAAEKVLKPTTSAGLYDDRLDLHDEAVSGLTAAPASTASGEAFAPPTASAHSEEAGGAPEARSTEADFVQAMALQDDDRFLSLATGEAQADALDVGTPEAGAPPGAFSPASVAAEPVHLPTLQEVNDPLAGQDASGAAAPPSHDRLEEDVSQTAGVPSIFDGRKDDGEEQPREGPMQGTDAQADRAGGAPEDASSVGDALEDFKRKPAGHHALDPSRLSISSTAATLGDRTSLDVSRVDSSWSQGKSDAETSSTAAAGSTGSAGGADPAVLEAATEQPAQSPAFKAGVPATSSDADPFYATDLALKVSAAQEEKQDLPGPKASAEMLPTGEDNKHARGAATDDLFGGLNVAPALPQEHVPASTSLI